MSKVGLSSQPLPSGSILFEVGLSYAKGVCPVQGGSVLFKVGLSCPKWLCSLPSGSVLS